MSRGFAWLGVLAIGFFAAVSVASAWDARSHPSEMVSAVMALLKAEADQLGPPRLDGGDVGVPTLYFGATRINDNFALIDEAARRSGLPHATVGIYLKGSGPDPAGESPKFMSAAVRYGENARESGKVMGWMRPMYGGPSMSDAIAAIRANRAYHSQSFSGGQAFQVACEPIHDAANDVIGFFFVAIFVGWN